MFYCVHLNAFLGSAKKHWVMWRCIHNTNYMPVPQQGFPAISCSPIESNGWLPTPVVKVKLQPKGNLCLSASSHPPLAPCGGESGFWQVPAHTTCWVCCGEFSWKFGPRRSWPSEKAQCDSRSRKPAIQPQGFTASFPFPRWQCQHPRANARIGLGKDTMGSLHR